MHWSFECCTSPGSGFNYFMYFDRHYASDMPVCSWAVGVHVLLWRDTNSVTSAVCYVPLCVFHTALIHGDLCSALYRCVKGECFQMTLASILECIISIYLTFLMPCSIWVCSHRMVAAKEFLLPFIQRIGFTCILSAHNLC